MSGEKVAVGVGSGAGVGLLQAVIAAATRRRVKRSMTFFIRIPFITVSTLKTSAMPG
jgi:hypothetical protein